MCICLLRMILEVTSYYCSITYQLLFTMEKVCYGDLRFPGLYLFTDVSGQPFGPIFKGQADKEE